MQMNASCKAALLIRLLFLTFFGNKRNATPAILAESRIVIPSHPRFAYLNVTFSQLKVQAIAPQSFAEKYATPGGLYISRAHFPAAVRTFHILSPPLPYPQKSHRDVICRDSMVLYFYNNLSKKAKPRFCLFHSIWQSLALRKG